MVIVEALEAVGVDHQQRQRRGQAAGPGDFARQSAVEGAAVGDVGEAVAHGEAFEPLLEALALSDVAGDADDG